MFLAGLLGLSCQKASLNHQATADFDTASVKVENEVLPKQKLNDTSNFRKTADLQIQKLISASRNGDLSLVKSLTNSNELDINQRILYTRNYWLSPLSEAVKYKHYDIVEFLVHMDADPNLSLGEGGTALQYAAGSSPSNVFKMLLENGGEVNKYLPESWSYRTAMSRAVERGNLENVKLLISNGALLNPDSLNGYESYLVRAAAKLELGVFKELLESGSDVNATYTEPYEDCILCPEEITITHFLVGMYYYTDKDKVGPFLDLVLARTPNLNIENSFGYTPLEFAMLGDNYELVERLIDAEAKLETEGYSSLHVAAQFSNHEMVDYLITKGVNVNIKDEYEGNTPLMLCMDCCGGGFGDGITYEDRIKTIRLLIDSGADPYIKNNEGKSFMESVKSNKYPEITALLLDFGFIKEKDIEK